MIKFFITPWTFGIDEHLHNLEGGISISREFPTKADIIRRLNQTEVLVLNNRQTAEKFCKLYGIDFPIWPPKEYKQIIKTVMPKIDDTFRTTHAFPWDAVMTKKKYYQAIFETVSKFEKQLQEIDDLSYWFETFVRRGDQLQGSCIGDLFNALIDREKLSKHISTATPSQKEILRSFSPTNRVIQFGAPWGGDWADIPHYSSVETITGRLKVLKGPNILGLKKEYRDILISRHGDKGKIWYLDYASLEPRTLLAINNPLNSFPLDIYTKTLEDLNLKDQVPRNVAKTAILSSLYGQSEDNTAKQLAGFVDHPEDFVKLIGDYFQLQALREKLAADLLKHNGRFITNYYGRPIFCEDTKPYALLNYYIQSTAVDIALLGFSAITNRVKEHRLDNVITPLYILHDAMILDVHEDAECAIPKLERLGSTGIVKFKNTDFFLRAEEMISNDTVTE